MVIEEIKDELKNTIVEYGIDSMKSYYICKILCIENEKRYNNNALQNYYLSSIIQLIKYMKINGINPNESTWNKYSIEKKCLSSKTMGYMYGNGFNNLCRKIRKEINRKQTKKIL